MVTTSILWDQNIALQYMLKLVDIRDEIQTAMYEIQHESTNFMVSYRDLGGYQLHDTLEQIKESCAKYTKYMQEMVPSPCPDSPDNRGTQ
jgi:hypothetical protein